MFAITAVAIGLKVTTVIIFFTHWCILVCTERKAIGVNIKLATGIALTRLNPRTLAILDGITFPWLSCHKNKYPITI